MTTNELASDIAQYLADMVAAMDFNGVTVVTSPFGVRSYNKLPAMSVALPAISRRSVDEPDSQLGGRDVNFTFPVEFVFAFNPKMNPAIIQAKALEIIGGYMDAVDADNSLGNLADDAIVTQAEWDYTLSNDNEPQLIVAQCTTEVFRVIED